MRKLWIFAVVSCLMCAGTAGETLHTLPWSKRLNNPERFDRNSSGRMTVSYDEAEQAVRFDVQFDRKNDFWVYPRLRLQGEESLVDVDEIRFEFRAEQPEGSRGYAHAYFMFFGSKPYVTLPAPKEQWQSVTVRVADFITDPAAVKQIAIGMNPRSSRLTYWIRNLRMLSRKPFALPLDTAEMVVPAAPGTVFTQGEPLEFSLESSVAAPARWTLKEWRGRVLRSGDWPESGKGKLLLDALPDGYYFLTLDSGTLKFTGSRSFAVVPDPAPPRNCGNR